MLICGRRGGVVEVTGDERHFEVSRRSVGGDFCGGDEKEAALVNEELMLAGIIGGFCRE